MEDDRPITNPPSTHPDQQQLLGWQQQPQLGLLHRFTDLVEQLPLPCPEEATSTVVSPPDPVQLQGLLSQPSVLQGVQHALASTRMQHIVPRQSGPSLEPSPHDPVLSALLQGCPDLLRRTAPPRGMATPGPLQANTLGQPEVQQGVEDHLMSYTDPVAAAPHAVPATGSKAKPKEVRRC
ncbi:hypothetical protein DUNSADRAFT_14346 [Dunaliella salina]|uniref:Encoded protein n=1 Tax=Dunaliella salina TaxID=3046 RepID=A0ABQ7G7I5_DUNSA|nr:hypothetical protein DUNSADRAFT_14346 [Dunaliella salina]|eukprot:KAF5830561.1 hypothetical protein DUNSADRAFT_14346 [Dunaliella salina]